MHAFSRTLALAQEPFQTLQTLQNHEQVAHLLLESGAAVDASEEGNYTALIVAAQNGREQVCAHSHRKDVMEITDATNHEQVVRALLEAGANVNHESDRHVTALNFACEQRHEACAVLLLQAGARADVEDDWGDTPLSIAREKGLAKALALMEKVAIILQ